jgi:hypothetical protein
MSQPTKFDPLAGILSYLIPGLGQICQGRIGKGLLFLVILLGMFHLGQAMGNWQNVYMSKPDPAQPGPNVGGLGSLPARYQFAGQFWIGVAAWPAIAQYMDWKIPLEGEFWQNYQRAPRDFQDFEQINDTIKRSDKTPDLGWVYTVIAGMLNVLVIYDAVAGPAFPDEPKKDDKDKKDDDKKDEPAPAGTPGEAS